MSPHALAARIVVTAALILAAPPRLRAQVHASRITCGSVSPTQQTCRTTAYIVSARLERELNGKRCRTGSTWGYTNSYVWTRSGCRAEFLVSFQKGGVASNPGSASIVAGTRATIHCGDPHGARIQCSAGGYINSARIVRQQLAGRCRPNDSWGYSNTYVWTEKMCIADFEVTYGDQSGGGNPENGTYSNGTIRSGTLGPRVITCGASNGNNGNRNGNGNGRNNGRGSTITCNTGGRIAGVRLVRSDNASRCRQGNTWGWSGREIWTKNGCRGDFEVTWAVGRDR